MILAAAAIIQQGPPEASIIETMAPLLLIGVAFWFLILRPQNKKMKEHRETVNNMQRGDTVVTAGGIIGKVIKVKDGNEIEIEIAKDIKVKIVQSTISEVRSKNTPVKMDAKEKADKKETKAKADKKK